MNDRRKFLGQIGLGLASLALPGVGQACGRRRRRNCTCLCSQKTPCACTAPSLNTDGKQACPFELTMVMNGVYYYCCCVCPQTSPETYVGEDVNYPGLSGQLSTCCNVQNHCFNYPLTHRPPPTDA